MLGWLVVWKLLPGSFCEAATPQKCCHTNSYHHAGCLSVVHLHVNEKASVSLVIRRNQVVGRPDFPRVFKRSSEPIPRYPDPQLVVGPWSLKAIHNALYKLYMNSLLVEMFIASCSRHRSPVATGPSRGTDSYGLNDTDSREVCRNKGSKGGGWIWTASWITDQWWYKLIDSIIKSWW